MKLIKFITIAEIIVSILLSSYIIINFFSIDLQVLAIGRGLDKEFIMLSVFSRLAIGLIFIWSSIYWIFSRWYGFYMTRVGGRYIISEEATLLSNMRIFFLKIIGWAFLLSATIGVYRLKELSILLQVDLSKILNLPLPY